MDVTVPDIGGHALSLAEITLSGGGGTITASTTIDGADAGTLLADAVEAALGARPSAVTLSAPDPRATAPGGGTRGERCMPTG